MTKNKDKKSKESTIGKIIYGFLLFMPLIAIASAILIGTFNMSTKSVTRTVYKYETNEINEYGGDSSLIQGNIYHMIVNDVNLDDFDDGTMRIAGYLVYIDEFFTDNLSADLDEVYAGELDSGEAYIYFECNFNGYHDFIITFWYPSVDSYISDVIECGSDVNLSFDFVFDYFEYTFGANDYVSEFVSSSSYNEISSIETNNVSPNEIFYTAINDVEQSNLFNWAKNSIVYTTLTATCNALSITNTFIPMLLAYWLIISVIYILYDIALMMIIIFHHKVHCLQDSI